MQFKELLTLTFWMTSRQNNASRKKKTMTRNLSMKKQQIMISRMLNLQIWQIWNHWNMLMLILDHDIISHVASMSRVWQSWAFINHLANYKFNHHSSSIQALTCSLRSRLMSRIEMNSHWSIKSFRSDYLNLIIYWFFKSDHFIVDDNVIYYSHFWDKSHEKFKFFFIAFKLRFIWFWKAIRQWLKSWQNRQEYF
jgi:hypothetical protein